jgi:FAD/FMN-containing dehydrogenase
MSARADTDGFIAALEGVPLSADPARLARLSRDNFSVSPLLRQALAGRSAEVVVAPRDRGELIRAISAAVRHRVPLVPRGGGTANYGQSVPMEGGALLDLRGMAGVIWKRPGAVRALGGTRMDLLDAELRETGWELRIHPSTRKDSTLAGFIAGGSGGMGSGQWGMLRDAGNITAVEMLSMEEEPRAIELRGADAQLAHHAYGTTGLITEIELPLAPAWPWREVVLGFPGYGAAIRFALRLLREPGVLKKLTSVQEWPAPAMMSALGGLVPQGHSAVFVMLAEPTRAAADALIAEHGGAVLSDAAEGENPFGAPLYEFSYGHGLRQIQKSHPRTTRLQAMFPPEGLVARLERVRERLAPVGPMCTEFFLSEGEVVGMGSPYIPFQDAAQMAALVAALQEEGAQIANNHASTVAGVGIKRITARDLAFKREMDPHGLLNPGKLDGVELAPALATTGWSFRRA